MEWTHTELVALVREIKAMPDSFFSEYEGMLEVGHLTEEQKANVRTVLEKEAERRGLRSVKKV